MDDDDWYGAHYLHDFAAALQFSDAGVVGWSPVAVGEDDFFLRDTYECAIPHLVTTCFDFVYQRGNPSQHLSKRPTDSYLSTCGAVPLPRKARVEDLGS